MLRFGLAVGCGGVTVWVAAAMLARVRVGIGCFGLIVWVSPIIWVLRSCRCLGLIVWVYPLHLGF